MALSSAKDVQKIYSGNTEVLCLLALTPLGLEASIYKSPTEWNRFQPASLLDGTPLSSPTGIAQHLFMNTYRFNAAASAWFQKTPRGKEKVLRQMFTSKSMQPRQKDMPYHDVAQMMVLDQVVWAIEEPTALYGGGQGAIPPQWDASLDEEPLTTTITDAIESCRNWPSTFATFMEGWKRREKEKEVPQMMEDVTISGPVDASVTILKSLGHRIGVTANDGHLNYVESNFAAAALGLHALAQVGY